MEMPVIDPTNMNKTLTEEQVYLVRDVFTNRGGKLKLRASRPTKAKGATQYIWRMVCFIVSPNPQHHCMPVGADFYINESEYAHRTDQYIPRLETDHDRETVNKWNQKTWDMMHKGEKRKKYIKEELDPLVDIIIESIPKNQWHGAKRWHKALYG